MEYLIEYVGVRRLIIIIIIIIITVSLDLV